MLISCVERFLEEISEIFIKQLKASEQSAEAIEELNRNKMRALYIVLMQKYFDIEEENAIEETKKVLAKTKIVEQKDFLRYVAFAQNILPVLNEDAVAELNVLLEKTSAHLDHMKDLGVRLSQFSIIQPLLTPDIDKGELIYKGITDSKVLPLYLNKLTQTKNFDFHNEEVNKLLRRTNKEGKVDPEEFLKDSVKFDLVSKKKK